MEVQEATSEDSYFVYHLNDVLKLSSSKNKPKLLYAEIYDKDILIKWDGTTRISFKVLKANKSTQVFSQIINKKSTLLIDKETVNSWKDVVDGRGYLWLSISATSGNITITD